MTFIYLFIWCQINITFLFWVKCACITDTVLEALCGKLHIYRKNIQNNILCTWEFLERFTGEIFHLRFVGTFLF